MYMRRMRDSSTGVSCTVDAAERGSDRSFRVLSTLLYHEGLLPSTFDASAKFNERRRRRSKRDWHGTATRRQTCKRQRCDLDLESDSQLCELVVGSRRIPSRERLGGADGQRNSRAIRWILPCVCFHFADMHFYLLSLVILVRRIREEKAENMI